MVILLNVAIDIIASISSPVCNRNRQIECRRCRTGGESRQHVFIKRDNINNLGQFYVVVTLGHHKWSPPGLYINLFMHAPSTIQPTLYAVVVFLSLSPLIFLFCVLVVFKFYIFIRRAGQRQKSDGIFSVFAAERRRQISRCSA